MMMGQLFDPREYLVGGDEPPALGGNTAAAAAEAAARRLAGGIRRPAEWSDASTDRISGGLLAGARALASPVEGLTGYSQSRVAEGPMTEEEAFRINQGDVGKGVAQLGAMGLRVRNPLGALPGQFELRGGELLAGSRKGGRIGDVAEPASYFVRPATGRLAEPPSSLFDYSKVHDVPDVKQFDLPRYDPKRGVSERVADLVKDKRVERQMLEKIEAGKGIGAGAETFYYNEPLRDAFRAELGVKKGPQAFERYMDYVAGSSPRSAVEENARNASFYYGLERQNKPLPEKNPYPYGHMAQNLHRENAEKIRSGEYFDMIKNSKPMSFSQNLQGNFAPVTVDAHALKLPAMLRRDPEFLAGSLKLEKGQPTINPTKMFESGKLTMDEAFKRPVFWAGRPNPNEYAAMEQYYKRLAAEAGMTPAQTQAAAWAGGGKITGLESVAGDPFMRAVENRANVTARRRGITPAEALSRMMRGKEPLLAIPPAAVMGGAVAQDRYQQ